MVALSQQCLLAPLLLKVYQVSIKNTCFLRAHHRRSHIGFNQFSSAQKSSLIIGCWCFFCTTLSKIFIVSSKSNFYKGNQITSWLRTKQRRLQPSWNCHFNPSWSALWKGHRKTVITIGKYDSWYRIKLFSISFAFIKSTITIHKCTFFLWHN